MAIKFYPVLKPTARWREIVEKHFFQDKEAIILSRHYPQSIVYALGGPRALKELPSVDLDLQNIESYLKSASSPVTRGFCPKSQSHFLIFKKDELIEIIRSTPNNNWKSANSNKLLSSQELAEIAEKFLKNFCSKSS